MLTYKENTLCSLFFIKSFIILLTIIYLNGIINTWINEVNTKEGTEHGSNISGKVVARGISDTKCVFNL